MENTPAPFVKWLGGKRRVVKDLRKFYPKNYSCYFEPFLGGGSVLMDVNPHDAVVSDSNDELINVYRVVQHNVDGLIPLLVAHQQLNTKEYYLSIRVLDREPNFKVNYSEVERAARFIYLNKTGFNGLHRVNKKGENNVPYGSYDKPLIVDEKSLRYFSEWLSKKSITFNTHDYKTILGSINTPNNFVYLDPPYIPASVTSSFVSYDSNGFNLQDQKDVRDSFAALDDANNFVLLSNSDTELTRELYKDFNLHSISVQRSVGSKGASRVKVGELIIVGNTLNREINSSK